jgi:hypothetical protein
VKRAGRHDTFYAKTPNSFYMLEPIVTTTHNIRHGTNWTYTFLNHIVYTLSGSPFSCGPGRMEHCWVWPGLCSCTHDAKTDHGSLCMFHWLSGSAPHSTWSRYQKEGISSSEVFPATFLERTESCSECSVNWLVRCCASLLVWLL